MNKHAADISQAGFLQATRSGVFLQTKSVLAAKSSCPGGCLLFVGSEGVFEAWGKCTGRVWEGAGDASAGVAAGVATPAGA